MFWLTSVFEPIMVFEPIITPGIVLTFMPSVVFCPMIAPRDVRFVWVFLPFTFVFI